MKKSKSNVSGLRDDYGHEPVLDEDLAQEGASEFWGISDNDSGVSRAQAEVQSEGFSTYDNEPSQYVNVKREQPTVTETVPFRED